MSDSTHWGKFKHHNADGSLNSLPAGKIVCVGRNYAAHAKELNNPVPTEPVLFIKPNTTLQLLSGDILVPSKDCHYETELAVLIDQPLSGASADQVSQAIAAYTLALDLTRREKQSELKSKSLPWELAKSFDGACPLGEWVPAKQFSDQIEFTMTQNGELRQHGYTKDMLNPIIPLITYICQTFTLTPGDIVLTGTPAGVGELFAGDELDFNLDGKHSFKARVTAISSA